MSAVSETKESQGFLRDLDEFWFGKGSPTTLGVFRILMCSLTLINYLMISVDWANWFSERGFLPNWLERMWQGGSWVPFWGGPQSSLAIPRLNLLVAVTDDRISLAFYVFTLIVAFTATIGLFSRFSTIALAICVVTLTHRNETILHGGDTVIRVMCLYLAMAPCGRACSVDRLIRLWRGIETGEPIRVSLWAQRLIMYNMALIYFTTTWLKRSGNLWLNGTATYFPVRLGEFTRFPVPAFVNDVPFVKFTTYGTLLTEFCLGTLVFYRPARKYVLAAGIAMHAFIEYSMNIPLFAFLMISIYVNFYDGEEVAGWFQRWGQRLRRFAVTISLPFHQRLNPRGAAFFSAVDPLGLVQYLPGEAPTIDPSDVRRSWTHSLGALPWGWWPGLWRRLLSEALEPIPEQPRAEKRKK